MSSVSAADLTLKSSRVAKAEQRAQRERVDPNPLAPCVSSDTIDPLSSNPSPDAEADSFIHLPPVTRPHSPPRSASSSDLHLPQAVTDLATASRKSTVLPPFVFPDDKKKTKVQWEGTPRMQDEARAPSVSSARLLTSPGSVRSMHQKKSSLNEFHLSTPALERLGVNADILKKEKGMKKLGICDVDIERSEELRRYTGIATKKMGRNKAELVFGFTDEQLQRDKAIKRLGTSEQEIFDDYCRRVSMLGTHDQPMASF